ncbi:MAG TPA: amidohydrolase family protein [Dehalococcoidia bacterium]|nr:amidohydrolase family protein [Dehalococcoidia bacterium]
MTARRWIGPLATLLFVVLVWASPTRASQNRDLPLFDTHLHYSSDAWDDYPVEVALALLEQAGVYRALVSSTPDEGTLALHDSAPDRIVPVLRPYRTREDMTTWAHDPSIITYVEERLSRQNYRGIGEFHLSVGEAGAPVPRAFAGLAIAQDLFLHAHADALAVEQLVSLYPEVKVLWAHAGMSARPATVERLVTTYPNLWVELALRTDVAPDGWIDRAWADLFVRHPDRFMIGSDTWVPARWGALPANLAAIHVWLRQLPRDVAAQIAYRNAEGLFGSPSVDRPATSRTAGSRLGSIVARNCGKEKWPGGGPQDDCAGGPGPRPHRDASLYLPHRG